MIRKKKTADNSQYDKFLALTSLNDWLIVGYWIFFNEEEWSQITADTIITHDGFETDGTICQIDNDKRAAQISLEQPLPSGAFFQAGFELEKLVFYNEG